MSSVIAQIPPLKGSGTRGPEVVLENHQSQSVQGDLLGLEGTELQSLFDSIIKSPPELVDLAIGGLGPWATRLWFLIVPLGDDFVKQIWSLFVSAFRLHEENLPDLAPSEGRRYERAVAWVAVHAVLSRIDELVTHLASQHEACQGPGPDPPDVCPYITYSRPRELLGAMMEAALDDNPNEVLQARVCREAAARLQISPSNPALVRHVRQRLRVFKALGIEADRVNSDGCVFEVRPT